MLLIGFGHKARQGKDSAALAMVEGLPLDVDFHLCKYADALRKECDQAARSYGSFYALIEAWKEDGVMPNWVNVEAGKQRSLYQWWGTEFRRAQDPNYWVKRLFAALDKRKPDVVFVTDVRFPNECEGIKERGGYLVRVIRTTEPDVKVPEHKSEQALDGYTGWDYTLRAGDVPELKQKAALLYQEIKRAHEEKI